MPNYTLIELSNKSLEFTTRKVTSPEKFTTQVHHSPWSYFVYTRLQGDKDIEFNKQRLLDKMITDTATSMKECAKCLRRLNKIKLERGVRIP